jgi:S-adenosylmethionine/arginine decarboxylase-like enzyme
MYRMWGYHLMLDIAKCKPLTIRCPITIANFTKTLVTKIDMVPYGQPQIVKFGSGDKAGYTLVQLIETSNICAHFCDESNNAYIDVFSCKPYDTKIVEKVVNDFFKPVYIKTTYIERNAKSRLK